MKTELLEKLKSGLIVSCQAFEGEPLYGDGIMVRMANAAVIGGAKAIRTNGVKDIKQIKEALDVPVIGIIKKHIEGYSVYITPTSKEALEVLEAGADIVALDCTKRPRPEPLKDIFENIRSNYPNALIMADIATVEDAEFVSQLSPDFLATTLSGYTKETRNRPKPDIELVKILAERFSIPVIAEGNYWEPSQVLEAMKAGAFAVTIGSAITRPHLVTARFNKFIQNWTKNKGLSEVQRK
ncbi:MULTISPECIES: N-acetylmannosamine-6-phosphate 2-epimerase [Kosmotoga]|uniref:Putative N-acetylmannosamine-6-phosphate 2-epimerase n=1 Tax=Kosmotoga olearia (strain ATCC BAA-1733 / DSM 21960 / TBF 19.5.1) TaxID=521045 RepID=C5CIM1_KOSOT|nr:MULTISPECIES: N-acetylmannosamine-6-phosphate 2-epimerase [Kosmotoga]ACR79883.1 N-acylglucosamine-6-phosphate 2-epimerase [Kosmotoga olearia TBF 19.5.1]MDI3524263.1 N-acylglucosamine-6-phosphate 2-epimerase [Kosmotoga sp.]MDK2953710.1 N-acylglucosamine-6-phosphate 2-epimerase [Kosmotoga sp.]OAA21143.1 N-acetylmannosamine-6-phosphate 2-epimerase [Kosmotoga sp. DU53]